MPKLKKFNKNKNKLNTKNILISFSVIMGIMMATIISKSYAIYKLQQDYDIIKNKIGTYSMGDVRVAVLVDGKEIDTFPTYETNYKVESIECTNGVTATFDVENWQLNIADMSATSTKCTVSFNSKETNEITPVNMSKTELLALNEEYQNVAYENLKTKLLNDTYPIGSIYISTTDSTVDSVEQRFGGTWVRYATDTTLVGYKEGTNTINATGGSKIVTLVESNLPSHNHEISHTHRVSGTANDVDIYGLEYLAEKFLNHTHPIPSLSGSGTTTAAGEHTHNVYRTSGHAASGTNRYTAQGTGDTYKTTAAGNHTHEVTISTKASTTGTCGLILIDTITGIHSHPVDGETITIDNPLSGNTGAGLPVDIQDPYTVVYMYKRTA